MLIAGVRPLDVATVGTALAGVALAVRNVGRARGTWRRCRAGRARRAEDRARRIMARDFYLTALGRVVVASALLATAALTAASRAWPALEAAGWVDDAVAAAVLVAVAAMTSVWWANARHRDQVVAEVHREREAAGAGGRAAARESV